MPAAPAIRILIVDDHPLVRLGLSSLLSQQAGLVVCGEAHNGASALRSIDEFSPSVIIVDLSLSDGSGLELIRRVAHSHRSIRMLVCSRHDESLYARRALQAGAVGYVSKHEASATIVGAVRKVATGGFYLSDAMTDRIAGLPVEGQNRDERFRIASLTNQELEVFQSIGNGLSAGEIARKMHLSVKTIETHRRRVMQKLDESSITRLASDATRWVLTHNPP